MSKLNKQTQQTISTQHSNRSVSSYDQEKNKKAHKRKIRERKPDIKEEELMRLWDRETAMSTAHFQFESKQSLS